MVKMHVHRQRLTGAIHIQSRHTYYATLRSTDSRKSKRDRNNRRVNEINAIRVPQAFVTIFSYFVAHSSWVSIARHNSSIIGWGNVHTRESNSRWKKPKTNGKNIKSDRTWRPKQNLYTEIARVHFNRRCEVPQYYGKIEREQTHQRI